MADQNIATTSFSPKYSLVIPCFNEAGNLYSLIDRCRQIILKRNDLEVIFVNNGSKDDSQAIFDQEINEVKERKLRVCIVKENQGYGFGILTGLLSARGEAMGWTHADLQTDPADFLEAINLYEELNGQPAFIKGKRQRRKFRDQIFTTGMTFFEYMLLGHWLDDINAQPNFFQRSFFETLEAPPKDFSFDLFFLVSALDQKLPLYRIKVNFGDRFQGVGHNDTIAAKLKYSLATMRYSLKLRQYIKVIKKN